METVSHSLYIYIFGKYAWVYGRLWNWSPIKKDSHRRRQYQFIHHYSFISHKYFRYLTNSIAMVLNMYNITSFYGAKTSQPKFKMVC
uniref:Ovule protein n=1 Tax=Heterorhabditis bacteriophora TaxID=37862 RepID=A0A1I7WHE7_HETBA